MRKLLSKLEAMLTAAAFAEEGDVDTARGVLRESEAAESHPSDRPRPALRAVPRGPVLARRGRSASRPRSARSRSRA